MAVNLEKLNRVWDGIKSGELEHNQEEFFCGTAACIAGWVCHFEALEKDPELLEFVGEFEWFDKVGNQLGGYSFGHIAQDVLGLNDVETEILFSSFATPYIQQKVIDRLNQGQRLTLTGNGFDYHHLVIANGLSD